MFTSFKDYIKEENSTVYFTFGRMNPATIGHEKLLNKLAESAGKADYKVFLSQTCDLKENPLAYTDKVKYARKMFPKHARNITVSETAKDAWQVCSELYEQGYKKVVMVVGSDRVNEFTSRLNLYNGKEGRHGFYNFEGGVQVESAGVRDADAKGAEGASGSKMREFATEGNFRSFAQYLPEALSNSDAKKLFNDVRVGMGLQEQTEFKRHIQLEPVSETREQFVKGELFNVGDEVVIKETSEVATISIIGANYVIVESNGNKYRKWLHDIELVEEGQPEEGTPEAVTKAVSITPGQVNPTKALEVYRKRKQKEIKGAVGNAVEEQAKYHKGLSKSTIAKRKAHFEKGKQMDDDNPAAYTPAPGDANAKTKPSKYTLKFKRMYGEDINEDAGKSLADKAAKSGISKSILKQVYNRGVAAWRTGHRPGTTPQQWGHARVNSFITGGKTRTTADKDLWAKHKGSK